MAFINKGEMEQIFGDIVINPDDIISNSTYDEYKLKESFLKLSKDNQILLIKAIVSVAIVGYGGNSYGQVRHNDKVYDLVDVFNQCNVSYNKGLDEKYDESQLTPRRLVRLFRYYLKDYINKNNTPSYLWLKYSTHDKAMISCCFPGAENLVESTTEASYLYKTYKKLDEQMLAKGKSTKFVERIERTYNARGIKYTKD